VTRPAKKTTTARISASHAARVGTAEFRGNLAKYLQQAKAGTPVVIRERGRSAYVLVKLEESPSASVFGCMRDRTGYTPGTVVNADEDWSAGAMP
jgi:prevent-host-death family protein